MGTHNTTGHGKVMDVRALPCCDKHGLIVRTFVKLPTGDHFILVNGHDPVPIHHQFSAQWPGTFTWEYMMKGPEEVRVKITKLKALGKPAQAIATECDGH